MPGIAGIIARVPRLAKQDTVSAMVNCMMHESFYRSGTYVDDSAGVAVGWTTHAGSFSDCMPVWNENRDVCLIFSGESFVDSTEIESLARNGHSFEPEDASYLVHWYEELGINFLEKLNGIFSGVLIDRRERTVVLFNDRFGVNRINYHETRDALYFSSEAKSLLRVLPQTRKLDYQSLGEFFSTGCVMQNRTLFAGIELVPGGASWTFKSGQPARKDTYFLKECWESQPVISPVEYYEKLRETWFRILPRYFSGQERVALSLTGGVDSRMILACAPCSQGTLQCYSFGSLYRECADVSLSRKVAQICRQPHDTIVLSKPFFSEFPALVEKTVYISDGTLDPTGTADLYVNRIARQIAPIRITGLNGGEILRRLVAFKPRPLCEGLFGPEICSQADRAAATYARELKGNLQSFVALKQAAWHLYARLSVERAQLAIRSPYFDNEIVALAYQAPAECLGLGPALRLIAERVPALRQVGTDRAVRLDPIPLISSLQHKIQEFAFKAEYAYDYGMPHWVARIDAAVKPLHFEKLFLGRHKFYHYRIWYRDEFDAYLKDVLLDARTQSRPYLNAPRLEEILNSHIRGHRNYTSELHRLLTVEFAQRQLIEQN